MRTLIGNLYHLNAEEGPEDPDYPKSPAFHKRFGPRSVIHSYVDGDVEDSGPMLPSPHTAAKLTHWVISTN